MKSKFILIIILFLFASGIGIYLNNKEDNNKKDQALEYKEELSENQLIENYLNGNVLKPEYSGNVFCVYHKYGSEEKNDEVYYYLWTYCEEYYRKNSKIIMGSGVSMPVKLIAVKNNDKIQINGFDKPKDGEEYPKSIKEMFPDEYEKDAIDGFDVKKFPVSPREKANEFFKL